MKKGILIGLPLLLLVGGGSVVGLAYLGVVKVPFLFAKRKALPPPSDDGKGGPFAATLALANDLARQAATPPPKVASVAAPPPDPGPGEEKLANLWAEMPTDRLVALVDKWPEAQLGRILGKMDEETVTNLLAALPPTRAASLSRSIASATDEKAANQPTGAGK